MDSGLDQNDGDGDRSPEWLRNFQNPKESIIELSSSPSSSSSSEGAACKKRPRCHLSAGEANSYGVVEEQNATEEAVAVYQEAVTKNSPGYGFSPAPPKGQDSISSKRLANVPSSEAEIKLKLPKEQESTFTKICPSPSSEDEDKKPISKVFERIGASAVTNNKDLELRETSTFTGPDSIEERRDPTNSTGLCEDERRVKTKVASSLPLVFAEKIHRSKVLLECEGDALDLSGDMGAVGRLCVSKGKEKHNVFFDLKGIVYESNIVSSNSFFLVNVGQTEAKVEAIMNDFIQLRPDSNFTDTETMIEGTLEDVTFHSDDEGNIPVPAAPETDVAETDGNIDGGMSENKRKALKGKKINKALKQGIKSRTTKNTAKTGKKVRVKRKPDKVGPSNPKRSSSKQSQKR